VAPACRSKRGVCLVLNQVKEALERLPAEARGNTRLYRPLIADL
jgi:hypothetical protein